jgi:hypothetical protein
LLPGFCLSLSYLIGATNMYNKTKKTAAVLLFSMLFLSCAADNLIVYKRAQTNLRAYPDVVILGKSAVPEDVVSELYSLQDNVKLKIQQLGKFRTVKLGNGTESENGTLIVHITISEIRKVDEAAAFALGEFAGHARLEATVQLIDASNTAVLGQYWVKGYSAGGGLDSGTGEAISTAADVIVDRINRWSK